MNSFVLLEAYCVPEGFATDFACKWPGAAVRSADVDFQTVWSRKHLMEREGGKDVIVVGEIAITFW